jgi:2,3-bisphosphoglycerate-independent phosphoglycerate mutase
MKNVSLLVVLDGFGYRETTEDNAIAAAHTPNWDRYWSDAPHTLVSGSGGDVGLPDGQMGNSEVGHMNLGAGRVVYQDLTRINRAIAQGEFQRNRALNRAFDRVKKSGGALHVMGLLSPGGVHSHEDQIFACIEMAAAAGVGPVYLHAFLDGRDTPPRSAKASLEKAQALMARLDGGSRAGGKAVASIVGRYFAMDRDRRWDRVERAYNLLVRGEAPFHSASATEAIEQAYGRGENDEFVQPTSIHAEGELPVRINDGDVVIYMNFRADRARQLTRALVDPEFDGFTRRTKVNLADFVMLTRYADDIRTSCAFEPAVLTNTLGEYLSKLGKTQLRIAETEKYAHVTFFFSGGREEPYPGERRTLIPSPKVNTYDLCPQMSARKVTDELVAAIRSRGFDFIICNYANGDMVGHSGIFDAAVKAVETLDECLGRLETAIAEAGGQMLITADHGNVEKMRDHTTGQPHTAHTSEPVPLVYLGPQPVEFTAGGTLADVAPTLLTLMRLDVPGEMTGRSLVKLKERRTA